MHNTNYIINGCLIEPKFNRISCGDKTSTIEPRVMHVLILLIEDAGDIVTRELIAQKVWHDRTVSDSSLNRNIAILRKILDTDSSSQSCIKTIPKKGYSLQSDVEISDNNTIATKELDHKQESLSHSKENWLVFTNKKQILSICLLLGILLLMAYFILPKKMTSNPPFNADSKSNYALEQSLTLNPKEDAKAFCLDGLDDYVEVENKVGFDIGTGDFSISAWIKTSSQDMMTIVDKRDESKITGVKGFSLYLVNGILAFQIADGDGEWLCSSDVEKSSCTNYHSKSVVADNRWHLVNITLDRDEFYGIKFYVDGEFVHNSSPILRKGSMTAIAPLRIGSRSSSVSSLFQGNIGEVKIYNKVLSSDTIKEQFKKGLARSCE